MITIIMVMTLHSGKGNRFYESHAVGKVTASRLYDMASWNVCEKILMSVMISDITVRTQSIGA